MSESAALRIAEWWRRVLSTVIDGAITLGASLFAADRLGPHNVLQRGDGFLLWWIALGMIYVTALTGAKRGQTIGKMVLGVRIVRPDGEPIGYGRAFVRWVVTGALWMFGVWIGGVIDSVVALVDSQRRTIHDRLVDTLVVRSGA